MNRRLALSIAPLVFALFGGLLGMRVKRGGRGAGILLSLAVVIVYYLVTLLGESLARTGTVSTIIGEWMATGVMLLLSLILLRFNAFPRLTFARRLVRKSSVVKKNQKRSGPEHTVGAGRSGFPSLLDTSLFRTLTTSFVIGFIALVSIFLIFTLFELWRFIGPNHVPSGVVARYLLYLMPLVAVELFPATMLITVLITYALLARRSEAIAWWASGQSVYRLMMPGLLFAIAAGAGTWLVQEHLMPAANVKQEALRARIRGGQPRAITGTGRQWLASVENRRLYSYEFDEQAGVLIEPTIYELDDDAVHLSRVTSGKQGIWTPSNQMLIKDSETVSLRGMIVERQVGPETLLTSVDGPQVFRPTVDKPSQLSVVALQQLPESRQETRRRCRGAGVGAATQIREPAERRRNGVYWNAFGVGVRKARGNRGAVRRGRRERRHTGESAAVFSSWEITGCCLPRSRPGRRRLFSQRSERTFFLACERRNLGVKILRPRINADDANQKYRILIGVIRVNPRPK